MTGVPKKTRPGHSLVELVIAMGAATMLLGGLGSTIWVSSSALDDAGSGAVQTVVAGETIDDIMADLKYALSFSERTANAVTFQVPDRDGGEVPETIRYAWSGTPGDPLTMEYNGGAPAILANDVQQFNLSSRLRTMTGTGFAKGVIRAVVFEEFAGGSQPNDQLFVDIPMPGGTSEGDLLIAAVAIDGTNEDDLLTVTEPAGWNTITVGDPFSEFVYFGVWWKIATASEPATYRFPWNAVAQPNQQSFAWIMRFTGHDPTTPIHAWADTTGDSKSPASPSVTTTVDYALILRLGGFDDDDISVDAPGLSGHTPITMDQSNTGFGAVSGGAGYVVQDLAGSSGTSKFSLTKKSLYRTVTIAIAPQ